MLHAGHKTAGRLPRCAPSLPARPRLVRCRAVYNPPSSSTAASELDLLKSWSVVVPDAHDATSITPAGKSLFGARAATVSASTISSIVAAGSLNVSPAYQTAITAALNFDRCKILANEAERAQCKLDKATVNVGTLFSKEVEGRVCTKVSPTLHNNADAMVAKVHALLDLYKENGVPVDKLIFELPATWAGIQAAKQCEAKGVPTQITLVFSMTQAVAAAQAGASVIKVSVGRVREWYTKYPNALRDPHGPRQDAGYMSSVDPGVALVQQMYNYIKKYHPKTKLLVSGLRSRDDVMACSGADFLLVPTKVLTQLALTPTTAGYNDGLHAAKSEDEADAPTLSPNAAEHSNIEKMPAVTEEAFVSGMDMVATDLLKQGLKQQVEDAERLLPLLEKGNFSASF